MNKFVIAEDVLSAVASIIINAIHPGHSHKNVSVVLDALKVLEKLSAGTIVSSEKDREASQKNV